VGDLQRNSVLKPVEEIVPEILCFNISTRLVPHPRGNLPTSRNLQISLCFAPIFKLRQWKFLKNENCSGGAGFEFLEAKFRISIHRVLATQEMQKEARNSKYFP
jgi:hypothetical protein